MKDKIEIVKNFYDSNCEYEWNRLIEHDLEFTITTKIMNRYLKKEMKILDLGGGPGQYSIYFKELGYDITLVDLSLNNVLLAKTKAKEKNLDLNAYDCDARDLSRLNLQKYDVIFVMGPMYHLQKEEDRVQVLKEVKKYLKPNGIIFVSFICTMAGLEYYLSECPDKLIDEPEYLSLIESLKNNKDWSGLGFTESYWYDVNNIEPFFINNGFQKITMFGQEGIIGAHEKRILSLNKNEKDKWYDASIQLCENREYLTHSQHVMYVGKLK